MYKVNDILVYPNNNKIETIVIITDKKIVTKDQKHVKTHWTVDGLSTLLRKGYKIYTSYV